jgi:hypothetical protein
MSQKQIKAVEKIKQVNGKNWVSDKVGRLFGFGYKVHQKEEYFDNIKTFLNGNGKI